MTVLSSKKILQEKNTTDTNSITSLTLTQRALTDVSCLSEFKNLERLDLGFNNLSSLEGLKSCVNLKWLSVSQNKLQSLKGIEGLTKLTVLNAGKNKLKSMDEVKSLTSLRALILNDNEIRSICKLDQMKELNTIVLSRNPISSIGESLSKLISITKLSLSNCQLQTLDSSLKYCTELKELRVAHNEIMSVPSEFARLMRLQNLDMGNNLINNWSNLQVLSSLVNLKNLNLQGNPVAEKENLAKKVKKLLPNLHVFNARPIDKIMRKEVCGVDASNKAHSTEGPYDTINKTGLGSRHKRKELLDEKETDSEQENTVLEKRKKKSKAQRKENNMGNEADTLNVNSDEVKHKKQKKNKDLNQRASDEKLAGDNKSDEKSRNSVQRKDVDMIDNAETPFADLFAIGASKTSLEMEEKKLDQRRVFDEPSGFVTLPAKKKKRENSGVNPAFLELSQEDEIGLGGPSAWD